MERCGECGFDYDAGERADFPSRLRRLAADYRAALGSADAAALRAHPVAATWSALEYACHFRDVLVTQRQRVLLALAEEVPVFAPMRREERVTELDYNGQEPEAVAGQIDRAADRLAVTLAGLPAAGWARTAVYGWPVRAVRDVEWMARHTLHEGVHHLADIGRLLPG
jgi:S-DNA-T family DNA segregation ATPase FtsK/SpoIIIE